MQYSYNTVGPRWRNLIEFKPTIPSTDKTFRLDPVLAVKSTLKFRPDPCIHPGQ